MFFLQSRLFPLHRADFFRPAATLTQRPHDPVVSRRTGPYLAGAVQHGRCIPLVPAHLAQDTMDAAVHALQERGESASGKAAVTRSQAWAASVALWERSGALYSTANTTDASQMLLEDATGLSVGLLSPALFPGPSEYRATLHEGEGTASLLRPIAVQLSGLLQADPLALAAYKQTTESHTCAPVQAHVDQTRRALCSECLWAPLPVGT